MLLRATIIPINFHFARYNVGFVVVTRESYDKLLNEIIRAVLFRTWQRFSHSEGDPTKSQGEGGTFRSLGYARRVAAMVAPMDKSMKTY